MEKEIMNIDIIDRVTEGGLKMQYLEVDGHEIEAITKIANANGFDCELLGYDDLFVTFKANQPTSNEKVVAFVNEVKNLVEVI